MKMLGQMKTGFFATAAAGVMAMAMGVGGASAAPLPFQIDPSAIATGGPYGAVTATDLNGASDASIQQTGSTQTETGWLQGQSFTNNGVLVPTAGPFGTADRMIVENNGLISGPTVYNLYLKFQGTVSGLTGFGPGSGTVGPGGYVFALYADVGLDDVFNAGATSTSSVTTPTVTGGTGNDIVVAVGSALNGSAGFEPSTGAPFFDVVASFILCNGTANTGTLGGVTVAATNSQGSCGAFNGSSYFVNPVPFYSIAFNSSNPGSAGNVTTNNANPALATNATINGIVADINFVRVPEPSTILLFGSGLLGLGMFMRRRVKTA